MKTNRLFCLIELAAVAALYFFENNSGTRAALAVSALVPLLSVLWFLCHRTRRLSFVGAAPVSRNCGAAYIAGRTGYLAGLVRLSAGLRLSSRVMGPISGALFWCKRKRSQALHRSSTKAAGLAV